MEGGNNVNPVLLQNEGFPSSSHEVLDSLWIPDSPPPPPHPAFHGSTSIVNFCEERGKRGRGKQFFRQLDKEEEGNGNYDNFLHQPEKKRRLTADQVQFLEKSFEVENKLEPERKVQLAKELALQPRQVAIWFQNRRARYRTKQLEKEYDVLKSSYDQLKAEYDSLSKVNESLKNEVHLLTEKLLFREKGKAKSEPVDPTVNPLNAEAHKDGSICGSSPNVPEIMPMPVSAITKQEEASSIVDSDSPHCTDGNHSSLMVADNSSHVIEPELSNSSQDEDDDSLSRTLLQPTFFPKLEDEFYNVLSCSSGNLGLPVEDQSAWFWAY